ncbi:hypothetical protein ACRALDRAFT_1065752 [Sodiomyces alcalophilus JCM 7366]|uniref:uncharacterized protein n=1 Tax=Sodiomyces alcalophilus JCM 7366 TaxID=591952 RepID=UPI0039B626B4
MTATAPETTESHLVSHESGSTSRENPPRAMMVQVQSSRKWIVGGRRPLLDHLDHIRNGVQGMYNARAELGIQQAG